MKDVESFKLLTCLISREILCYFCIFTFIHCTLKKHVVLYTVDIHLPISGQFSSISSRYALEERLRWRGACHALCGEVFASLINPLEQETTWRPPGNVPSFGDVQTVQTCVVPNISWSSKTLRQWQEKESLAKLRLSLAEYQVLTPFCFVMFRLDTKNTLSNDHDMPFRSRLNTIETCWNGTVNLLLGLPLCSLKTVSCWCLWPTNLPQSISKPCQAHVSRTVRALLRLRHRN